MIIVYSLAKANTSSSSVCHMIRSVNYGRSFGCYLSKRSAALFRDYLKVQHFHYIHEVNKQLSRKIPYLSLYALCGFLVVPGFCPASRFLVGAKTQ